MAEYVDLDQKVEAQYYDEMTEEWDLKTTTIGHILDSVCDDYKIAVDIVEVVRCEDCKYFSPCYHTPFYSYSQEKRGDGFCNCEYLQIEPTVKDSFFCAYGERRADNGENDGA